MATFTIDTENNIVAHVGVPPASHKHEVFSTEAGLAELAAKWPSSRVVEIWNSLASTASFKDLNPVKKFTSRQTGVARIWQAIARLEPMVTPAKEQQQSARSKRKHASANAAPDTPVNKKAQVIAMLRQAKGVTLTGIMETTGWQKHTVRGFISILGRKGGMKIESAKNAAGHRFYRITK